MAPPATVRTGATTRLGPVLLTRLGIPKLWREDPELAWLIARSTASPATILLAPSFAYGAERVPRTGGAVLAVNHLAAIDPPLVGALSPRAIHFMAKAELLAMPVVGDLLHWIGIFPVRRGEGDRDALRKARERVRDGHVVGMFVEGTRQRFGYPGAVHAGGAIVAMQEGVPIVPCGVESFGWTRRNRRPCAVVFGEPFSLDELPRNGRGYKQGAEIIRAEIVRLWRQAGEAVAAGFPPELPDGTPRSTWVRPWQAIVT